LRRLAGKERRFQSWLNHQISSSVVQQAKNQSMAIALEDLSGIRERTNQQPRSKQERRRSNSWAFYQLRSFLIYKAVKFGVPLVFVNPAYTSKTCHKCLHIHPGKGKSYRNGKTYKCGHCGWIGDSDFNGANMISLLGAAVNTPRGSNLRCQIQGY
jgi:IS605 OrfB family transposase